MKNYFINHSLLQQKQIDYKSEKYNFIKTIQVYGVYKRTKTGSSYKIKDQFEKNYKSYDSLPGHFMQSCSIKYIYIIKHTQK